MLGNCDTHTMFVAQNDEWNVWCECVGSLLLEGRSRRAFGVLDEEMQRPSNSQMTLDSTTMMSSKDGCKLLGVRDAYMMVDGVVSRT